MSIENLPTELDLLIASLLPCESSLAALAFSALKWAAENDRIDTLQKTPDAGAPLPKEQPKDKSHPIELAAEKGHTNIVRYMIDRGVSPDIVISVMSVAAFHGHGSIIAYLLQVGARPWIKNRVGEPPIYYAASQGHTDVVELLLSATKECEVNPAKGEMMVYTLFTAMANGHKEIAQILVDATACLYRTRALADAVKWWKKEIVEMLLRSGAPTQFCWSEVPSLSDDSPGNGEKWVQPLLLAVRNRNLELAQLLLEHGADANVECFEPAYGEIDRRFNRVLFWAVEKCDCMMVNLLLEHGADPEITDIFGRPPLSYAVYRKCEGIIGLLLDHGANPYRAVDQSGRKLIMFWQMDQSTLIMLQEAEMKWTEQHGC
ncbi:hypothetical protein PENNAL_c0009G02674 [Penicillium nalgiovense]|uniref:Uncharacterized protein n=1 Tax=Penicillium nalgiovense TaxID=60175 RepID=A0A1V6YW80_PENNA|nr:hypothetical protein PENNAL_c0009G02674 [Penicillium nalgiovense]